MYSRLIHTVGPGHRVSRARPGFDAIDAFLTHMWAVTVTGAPKTWAMQFIEDHEETPRRWVRRRRRQDRLRRLDEHRGSPCGPRKSPAASPPSARGATLPVRLGPWRRRNRSPTSKARALLETLIGNRTPRPTPRHPKEPAAARTDESAMSEGSGSCSSTTRTRSFRHTLGDYFRQHGAEVTTPFAVRVPPAPARLLRAPDLVVLSPGPGRPADFACAAAARWGVASGQKMYGCSAAVPGPAGHGGARRGACCRCCPNPRTASPGWSVCPGGAPAGRAGRRVHREAATTACTRRRMRVLGEGSRWTACTPDGVVMAIGDARAAPVGGRCSFIPSRS